MTVVVRKKPPASGALDLLKLVDEMAAIIGQSGQGKSWLARCIAEAILADKRQLCIIDPTGVWWGTRAGADGDAAGGFKIAIFGGKHGDEKITPNAGDAMGRLIGTRAVSAIFDLSEMDDEEQCIFVAGFLRSLYLTNEKLLHLFIDEADEFAPQSGGSKETKISHNVMARVVKRGRVRGFRMLSLTQRPADISKRIIAGSPLMMIKRMTEPVDVQAIEKRLKGNAKGDGFLQHLDTLPRSKMILWGPALGLTSISDVPAITTYDSMKAPEANDRPPPELLADVDLSEIHAALTPPPAVELVSAKAPPEMPKSDHPPKANNGGPPVAKTSKPDHTPMPSKMSAPAPAKAPVVFKELKDADAAGYERGYGDGLRDGGKTGFEAGIQAARLALSAIETPAVLPPKKKLPAGAVRKVTPNPALPPADDGITPYQSRILEGIAYWNALGFIRPTKSQVAAVAEAKTGDYMNRNCAALKDKGLLEYGAPGQIMLSQAGEKEAPPVAGGTPRQRLAKILTNYQERILDALPKDGTMMSKSVLATMIGGVTGDYLNRQISGMKTMAIVRYGPPGSLAVETWVWAKKKPAATAAA